MEIGNINFSNNNNCLNQFNTIEKMCSKPLTFKNKFVVEYELKKDNLKYIIVAVQLPSGANEIITNTEQLENKYKYYIDMYDDDFCLKNNNMVKIVNFMLV